MPDLQTMLCENQVRLNRAFERLEKAGLPTSTRSAAEILRKIESQIRLPRRVRKDRNIKSPQQLVREIDLRTSAVVGHAH